MAPSNAKLNPQTFITFCICKCPLSQLQHLRPKYLVSRAAQTIKDSPTNRIMGLQKTQPPPIQSHDRRTTKERFDRSEFSNDEYQEATIF